MTAIEVALLLIGVVFILGSFFIVEKLSPEDLSRVAELSEEELRMVMNRELETASAKISDMADDAVDLSLDQIQRRLEKDTNEKIMAISEYSDSAMEKLQKINNEVTFLYSMLGDKHTELDACMAQLKELILQCQEAQSQAQTAQQQYQDLQKLSAQSTEQVKLEKGSSETERTDSEECSGEQEQAELADAVEDVNSINVREEILARYRAGEDLTDIARDLAVGYGEVKLIVELYKGEEDL